MQELGMTTLGMDKTFMEKYIYKAIPDMFGKKDAEIAKTPPFVQYLKCEDKIEKGDRTSLVSCVLCLEWYRAVRKDSHTPRSLSLSHTHNHDGSFPSPSKHHSVLYAPQKITNHYLCSRM